MKSKKKTYILLVVVLIIWALVIYQFFSLRQPQTAAIASTISYELKPLQIKQRDTFSIKANYRDPFLGGLYNPQTEKSAVNRHPKKVKPAVLWPEIIYKGIVSDSKDRKKVFMVLINGTPHFMKEKDIQIGVKLTSGNRKFIKVAYQGEQRDVFIL